MNYSEKSQLNKIRTEKEYNSILFKLAIKYGVSPKLIAEKCLSEEDKKDILNGLVSFDTISKTVELWKNQGMCDYAKGNLKTF